MDGVYLGKRISIVRRMSIVGWAVSVVGWRCSLIWRSVFTVVWMVYSRKGSIVDIRYI